MIVAQNLTKRFGRHLAVDSLNFEITRGHVVGILGPNGAGKSTTLRMITGFLPPSAGSVQVDGLDVSRHWKAVRQRIGFLAESAPLYPEMRVIEYLTFRSRLFGLSRSERNKAIERAIAQCQILEVRRRPINQLSKGYRQRVGLAAALLHDPPLLILDEPTVGLDPSQIREFRTLIRNLAGSHTILLSTHILPEVELTCDRVILIADGRIRGQGTISELQQQASSVSRYVVETDTAKAERAVASIPAVAQVQAKRLDSTWYRLTVTAKSEQDDLRESISRALSEVKSITRELHRQSPTLEHLFVHMVEGSDTRGPPETPEIPEKAASTNGQEGSS